MVFCYTHPLTQLDRAALFERPTHTESVHVSYFFGKITESWSDGRARTLLSGYQASRDVKEAFEGSRKRKKKDGGLR
eukprot:g64626.t1